MHSIRFKITSITVAVILAILLSIFSVCYSSVKEESDRQSVEMMRLIGQDTQNSLDEYFVSIEQSVNMAANEAIDSLDSVVLVVYMVGAVYAVSVEVSALLPQPLDLPLNQPLKVYTPLAALLVLVVAVTLTDAL